MSQAHGLLIRQQSQDGLVPTELPTPPGIPYDLFLGFSWAGVAVALLFLAGRMYARYRGPGRLFVDDALIIFASVLVVCMAALWQWAAQDMYHGLNVNAGVDIPGPDFPTRVRRWLTISFVVEMFYYTILITFKLSMLFFFKRLGTNVDRFGYLWWPVLLFSLATYFVSVGNIEYKCLFNSLEFITLHCSSAAGTKFLRDTLTANCVLDVVSDFAIMSIPMVLLLNVRMPWRKKLAFLAIFSVSMITIGVSIARAATIVALQKSNGLPDGSHLWFWSSCQSFLCIVVACSASFRQLFTGTTRSKREQAWKPTASYYDRMVSSFRARNKRHPGTSSYDISHTTTSHAVYEMRDGESSQVALQDSLSQPTFKPGEPEAAVTACYRAEERRVDLPENQIIQEREYRLANESV